MTWHSLTDRKPRVGQHVRYGIKWNDGSRWICPDAATVIDAGGGKIALQTDAGSQITEAGFSHWIDAKEYENGQAEIQ